MNKKHCFLLINLFLLFYISWPCNSEEQRDFKSVISRELKYIDDPSPISRETAISSLGGLYDSERIGITDPELHIRKQEIITAIKKCLTDENIKVQRASMIALIRIDTDTIKGFMPSLIEILKDKEETYDKQTIARYLKYVGADARDAVPALIELLKEATPLYSKNVIDASTYIGALESIGTPEASEAVKSYRQKLEKHKRLVRPVAIILSSRIGSSLMVLGLFGLFWWGRNQRKKGRRLIGWPLFIPMLVWSLPVYEPAYSGIDSMPDLIGTTFVLLITVAGIVPWLLSLLLRKRCTVSKTSTGATS